MHPESKFQTSKDVCKNNSQYLDVQQEPCSVISPLMKLLRIKEKEKAEKRKQQAEMKDYQVMDIPKPSDSQNRSKKGSSKDLIKLNSTNDYELPASQISLYETKKKGGRDNILSRTR